MRTSTEIAFDFAKKTIGYTTEEVPPVNIDETLKLYLPLLMSKIPRSNPKVWPNNISPSIFRNAQKCRPKPHNIVKEKNYIDVKKEDNVSMIRFEIEEGKIAKIPQGQRLQCTFTHGKLKDPTFTSSSFTDQG